MCFVASINILPFLPWRALEGKLLAVTRSTPQFRYVTLSAYRILRSSLLIEMKLHSRELRPAGRIGHKVAAKPRKLPQKCRVENQTNIRISKREKLRVEDVQLASIRDYLDARRVSFDPLKCRFYRRNSFEIPSRASARTGMSKKRPPSKTKIHRHRTRSDAEKRETRAR